MDALRQQPQAWVNFMIRFELGLQRPDPKHAAVVGAGTIAAAYIAAAMVPLGPYPFLPTTSTALTISAITTLIALAIFWLYQMNLRSARREIVRVEYPLSPGVTIITRRQESL